MSLWSPADQLTDAWTAHWTGAIQALVGLLSIDGKAYRFMGPLAESGGVLPPAMKQVSVTVHPTTTVYVFQQSGVELRVEFTVASLPDDLDLVALPHGIITLIVRATDGAAHRVLAYYDHTAELCSNDAAEKVAWRRAKQGGLTFMQMGTSDQKVLGAKGDFIRINWGYITVAVPDQPDVTTVFSGALEARNQFAGNGTIPSADDMRMPRAVSDDWPVSAVRMDLGMVGATPAARHLLLGYDDVASINFFGVRQLPYWARGGRTIYDVMAQSWARLEDLKAQCDNFDTTLEEALTAAGGSDYAEVGALAYRQVMGSCKLTVDEQTGAVRYFMKEISSDGDISTVDVIFPASPFYALLAPELLWLQMLPVLEYSNNETAPAYHYPKPWAAHHLGNWPIADILPKQQEDMPVEETANMLLMLTLVAQRLGNSSFLPTRFWPLLCSWGDYLARTLPDPGNQLCTDDFEGPSPHNVNLAAKGIVGLAAFARLLDMSGATCGARTSTYYAGQAQTFVQYWLKNAADGDHYKLQYTLANTWSLKYNLLFQRLLGLDDLFPASVFDTELKYYTTKHFNTYGIPLDNRADFTKLDWECWVGTMGRDTATFSKIISAIRRFANETPTRVPLTDWAQTSKPGYKGFQARPVIGGVYAKLLDDTIRA